MMLEMVKGIVSGRTLGGLGVGTQRYFEYIWHIVSHCRSSSGEKQKIFGANNLLVCFVHILRLTTRTRRKLRWIAVG